MLRFAPQTIRTLAAAPGLPGLLAPGVWAIDEEHLIETAWMERMQMCRLHRYTFDDTAFTPIAVDPVGNLMQRHEQAAIDLRPVHDLTKWKTLATKGPWTYSIIR